MKKQVESKRVLATLELLELIEENPELPIIAEVNSEVVADDRFMSWFGKITGAQVDYVWAGMYRTWTLNEALIENYSFIEENATEHLQQKLEKLNDADFYKETSRWIKSLPWKKYIVVYVDTLGSISSEPEIESKGAKDE